MIVEAFPAVNSRIYGAIGQWENHQVAGMRNRALSFVPRSVTEKLFRQIFDYDACAVSL